MNDETDNRKVAHDSGEDTFTDPATWLTPEEAGNLLRVSAEHIRAMIRAGRLEAVNLAIGKKRPLYRIRAIALDKIVADQRSSVMEPPSRSRFKRLPPVEDHFPGLR